MAPVLLTVRRGQDLLAIHDGELAGRVVAWGGTGSQRRGGRTPSAWAGSITRAPGTSPTALPLPVARPPFSWILLLAWTRRIPLASLPLGRLGPWPGLPRRAWHLSSSYSRSCPCFSDKTGSMTSLLEHIPPSSSSVHRYHQCDHRHHHLIAYVYVSCGSFSSYQP